jgi:hypothetical protein
VRRAVNDKPTLTMKILCDVSELSYRVLSNFVHPKRTTSAIAFAVDIHAEMTSSHAPPITSNGVTVIACALMPLLGID